MLKILWCNAEKKGNRLKLKKYHLIIKLLIEYLLYRKRSKLREKKIEKKW